MAAALLLLGACRGSAAGCPDPRLRLDRLLGGGPAVCLRGPFAQLDAHAARQDSAAASRSSQPGLDVLEGGVMYSYEPGGGLNLLLARPFGFVGRACATPAIDDSARAARLVERARRRAGGAWAPYVSSSDVVSWTRPDGLTIGYRPRRETTVCVSVEPPPPIEGG